MSDQVGHVSFAPDYKSAKNDHMGIGTLFSMSPTPGKVPTPEEMAQRFHEVYERLAPDFGYETREESCTEWEDVPENNRKLMIATCEEVREWLLDLLFKSSGSV